MKSDRERQIPYDIVYMWNLKSKNDTKRNRLTDLENELMVTRGDGWGGGIDWEFWIDMYTLPSSK